MFTEEVTEAITDAVQQLSNSTNNIAGALISLSGQEGEGCKAIAIEIHYGFRDLASAIRDLAEAVREHN